MNGAVTLHAPLAPAERDRVCAHGQQPRRFDDFGLNQDLYQSAVNSSRVNQVTMTS